MSISLIGICGLQWYWVSKAIAEKEAEYDRSIQRGLYAAIDELKDAEIETLFITKILQSNEEGDNIVVVADELSTSDDAHIVHTSANSYAIKRTYDTDSKTTTLTQEVHVGSDEFEDVRMFEGDDVVIETKNKVIIGEEWTDKKMTESNANRFVQVLGDIIHEVEIRDSDYEPDIEKRVGKTNLDSLLSRAFLVEGIEAPFQYAMISANSDTISSQYTNMETVDYAGLDFSVPVFQEFPENTLLKVGFPSKNTFIFRSLGEILMLVLLFSLLMLGTFVATIHAILKQKRLAEVKSDFINNMTHEFKTPLATIGLAVESINHPQVKNNPGQIDRFTSIIAEEKNRLNGHVEKILQLAKMDKGELVIEKAPCDFTQVAGDAVTSMELRVQAREGALHFATDQEKCELNIDANHLYNVMVNLIDNALKYTEGNPAITVRLQSTTDWVKLTVSDNGIGMSNEVQKKAFDAFYRAQSGDVHNVKGFGVGLSYVREVIGLHAGEIVVKSALGKGSTVGFKLPIHD